MTRLMDDVSIQDYGMAFDHGSPTIKQKRGQATLLLLSTAEK